MNVVVWLRNQGFEKTQSLRGGIDAWSAEIDPAVPRYHECRGIELAVAFVPGDSPVAEVSSAAITAHRRHRGCGCGSQPCARRTEPVEVRAFCSGCGSADPLFP